MARGKGSSGGGGGGGGGTNIRTVILGVISVVISLIMLGIAMDVVTDLLDTVDFTDYPGAEAILGLFPLLMMISLVFFGGLLVWLGIRGQNVDMKGSIMVTIVVVVAIILLPIVMDATDTLMDRADIGDYTGLASFLGLVPLLYVIGAMAITGILGFKTYRGSTKKKAQSPAY